MSRQIVIYAARDPQQAHLLKNELQRYGIRAWVTNEALSRGFSVECPSWGTLPRVVVEEKNAVVARHIALSHDKHGAQSIESQLPDPSQFEHDPQAWPRCPRCGAPRPTRCPICKTTGTDFPESDPDYAWGLGLEEVGEGDEKGPDGSACSCDKQCGCHTPPAQAPRALQVPDEEGVPLGGEVADVDEKDAARPFILRCTMCDEPFSPTFSNGCPWCGETFEDGYEAEPFESLPSIGSPVRIFLTVLGLLLVGLLVLGLFVGR